LKGNEMSNWKWELAHPLRDVEYIVEMAQKDFECEVDKVLSTDPNVFRHQITVSATNQLFDKHKEFIAVAKEDPYSILGYCWFDRGGYTTYSRDEISNARFHHVDLTLPLRTRYKLINEMIDQHILWADMCRIPVVCSTSIRGDHEGFMKIHKKRGFQVNGSYAWIRTEEAMKELNVRSTAKV
jgi:hypothetical protein